MKLVWNNKLFIESLNWYKKKINIPVGIQAYTPTWDSSYPVNNTDYWVRYYQHKTRVTQSQPVSQILIQNGDLFISFSKSNTIYLTSDTGSYNPTTDAIGNTIAFKVSDILQNGGVLADLLTHCRKALSAFVTRKVAIAC